MAVEMSDQQRLTVVVPFFNEMDSLPLLHEELHKAFSSVSCSCWIVYVDDGSSDTSWELVSRWALNGECEAIRFVRNFGKEAAIRAGLQEVPEGAAVVMDADMQHPPEILPKMVSEWMQSDAWVVEARKAGSARRGLFNELGARCVYYFMYLVTGIHFDGRSDFCLLDAKVVSLINQMPEKVTFFRGVVSWFGFPAKQVYFEVPERKYGSSKWSFVKLVNLAIDMITGFTTIPLSIVTCFSFLFLCFSGVLILHTLYMFFSGQAVEGFTTVIICILLVGSVLAGGMGILGQYLARIYEEVKKRPMFAVREVIRKSSNKAS
ncbi:MAG: glycosyltransferase family 2 protein [Verrucomicrobiota bacterium]